MRDEAGELMPILPVLEEYKKKKRQATATNLSSPPENALSLNYTIKGRVDLAQDDALNLYQHVFNEPLLAINKKGNKWREITL